MRATEPTQPDPIVHEKVLARPERPKLTYVQIAKIFEDSRNDRSNIAPQGEGKLVDSIKRLGIMQTLVLQERSSANDGSGGYRLIAGHRRLEAATKAGEQEVPAMVYAQGAAGDLLIQEMRLAENLDRLNLTPIEEAFAVGGMIDAEEETVASEAGKKAMATAGDALAWEAPPPRGVVKLLGGMTANEVQYFIFSEYVDSEHFAYDALVLKLGLVLPPAPKLDDFMPKAAAVALPKNDSGVKKAAKKANKKAGAKS